jgi:hypothetical protein
MMGLLMGALHRKKAFIFGVLFALGALLAPGLTKICQAATSPVTAAHPCCQGKAHCGPQVNSQCCCQGTDPSSRTSIPVPQANPEVAKIFPLLGSLLPSLQDLGTFLSHPTTTIGFHAPPSFLAHHSFLC